MIPKKELQQMYLDKEMTQLEIGKVIGVDRSIISDWMNKYNIKSRTRSKAKLGRSTGENSKNWQGGISFEPYCNKFNNEFKEAIRSRDDYICQLCGCTQESHGKKLSIHHIHYDKENCYPDVVALCRSCNSKVNNDRDYWEQYFENLLIERKLLYWNM